MHYCVHCGHVDADQRMASFLQYFCQKFDFSLQIANATAVSIALPTIQKEMNLEPAQLQWIMSAYPLSSVGNTRLSVFLCTSNKDSTHHRYHFLGLPLPRMR